MQIQMTEQVARIFEETEKMTLNEKQSLFWIMVEKWGQENILNYNTTNTNQMLITVPKYLEIRKFGNENILKSNLQKLQNACLNKDFEYSDEDFYLQS